LGELKKVGRVHSERVEQAGFAVLKSPDVPSILVETAYITNPHEEKLLRSNSHQDKVARAIVAGVKRYVAKNPGFYAQRAAPEPAVN
jgi:N-acetylmuramoyl-L-alanine amidase